MSAEITNRTFSAPRAKVKRDLSTPGPGFSVLPLDE